MKALVTGAAGFIGSSIVDRLLRDGFDVVGIDCFTPYYDRKIKLSNLEQALDYENFDFHEVDISNSPLSPFLDGVTNIFHQAGQPGVRSSWGTDFQDYVRWNILGTQQLLEECKKSTTLKSFVAASSSSVYGKAEKFPTSEKELPQPISPYGVTKLASENLCSLYGTEFGIPTVSLRYFTVYGPRQRPDMAITRIITAIINRRTFTVFGDGFQHRDFTYVDDVVEANILVAKQPSKSISPGRVFNVGGNQVTSLSEIIEKLEEISGLKLDITFRPIEEGDPKFTSANSDELKVLTGWSPTTKQLDGLSNQFKYLSQKQSNS
jgi:nucleoside-diphosphate-sugar epimerase